MTVNELINFISEPILYSLYSAEEYIGKNAEKVASHLYPDEHRWYQVSTDVYKCEDGYVGVTGPSNMYSESSTWKDINFPCFAEEFVPVTTTTYKQKD
jgi:hypothetical protein